ncbi:MAG: hypothetical protein ACYTAQ_04570 [Planctomycetota bacterium]
MPDAVSRRRRYPAAASPSPRRPSCGRTRRTRNQTDQDTLPPYEVLDAIVQRYIEREQSVEQIVEETDFESDLVGEVTAMIDRAQHKRDQMAPALKVSPRAFGRGRPMPIAMKWEEGASGVGRDSPRMAAWPSTSCRRSS